MSEASIGSATDQDFRHPFENKKYGVQSLHPQEYAPHQCCYSNGYSSALKESTYNMRGGKILQYIPFFFSRHCLPKHCLRWSIRHVHRQPRQEKNKLNEGILAHVTAQQNLVSYQEFNSRFKHNCSSLRTYIRISRSLPFLSTLSNVHPYEPQGLPLAIIFKLIHARSEVGPNIARKV